MRMNKVCAILNLAGQESSLNPLTLKRPIAALPFACRYRVVDFMLSSIAQARIESVALFIEESGRSIYDHIRNGREWDLDGSIGGGIFTYSQQRRKLADYLTTRPNESFFENQKMFIDKSYANYVVVMEGDMVHNLDLEALVKYHVDHDAEITVAYKTMSAVDAVTNQIGIAYEMDDDDYLKETKLIDQVQDGRVSVDGHVYVVNKDVLYGLFDKAENEEFFVDIGALIRENLSNRRVSMYEYTGYFAKINSIESYYEANMSMLNSANFNALFHGNNTIITRSKSGVPTYYATEALVKDSLLATGCMVYGTVNRSLLARKTRVAKHAHVSESILNSGVKVGEGAVVEYAIVDKGAIIEAQAVVRGTREQPVIIEKNQVVRGEVVS